MSIPTADLRALEKKWRGERDEDGSSALATFDWCADELDALIVKAEAQVGEAPHSAWFEKTCGRCCVRFNVLVESGSPGPYLCNGCMSLHKSFGEK